MSQADDENVDHIKRKLNKILETRYDTDKVRILSTSTIETELKLRTSSTYFLLHNSGYRRFS